MKWLNFKDKWHSEHMRWSLPADETPSLTRWVIINTGIGFGVSINGAIWVGTFPSLEAAKAYVELRESYFNDKYMRY